MKSVVNLFAGADFALRLLERLVVAVEKIAANKQEIESLRVQLQTMSTNYSQYITLMAERREESKTDVTKNNADYRKPRKG